MKKINKLKAWKEESGMEWSEIAKKVELSESALYKIIAGENNDIKLSSVIAIEKLTGLPVWEYMDLKFSRTKESGNKYLTPREFKRKGKLIKKHEQS